MLYDQIAFEVTYLHSKYIRQEMFINYSPESVETFILGDFEILNKLMKEP